MEKRGLSTIVVTLILIVLSLIAVGAIWMIVNNIIKSNSNNTGISGLTINLKITNAYEQDGKIYTSVVRNPGEGELSKIKFIFSDGINSEIISNDTSLAQLDTNIFAISLSKLTAAEVKTVSIAPVFKLSDGTESTGAIADTYNIAAGGEENPSGENPEGENPNCTPNCGLKICGDDGCGGICSPGCSSGTCSQDGLSCVNCIPKTCQEQGYACGTPSNGCGGILECGNCPSGQLCSEDYLSCASANAVNTGLVEDVWPGTSGLYFGSSSLSTTEDYQGDYVKFPGSLETRCLLIIVSRLPIEGYYKSHVGFNFETMIKAGDNYQIFNTVQECNA
ncbi:Uncharacterised protein [uncultured archaeon]|nr:Uncharacterised protein [uncultured archaeon]